MLLRSIHYSIVLLLFLSLIPYISLLPIVPWMIIGILIGISQFTLLSLVGVIGLLGQIFGIILYPFFVWKFIKKSRSSLKLLNLMVICSFSLPLIRTAANYLNGVNGTLYSGVNGKMVVSENTTYDLFFSKMVFVVSVWIILSLFIHYAFKKKDVH